jgi:hypothetical protein
MTTKDTATIIDKMVAVSTDTPRYIITADEALTSLFMAEEFIENSADEICDCCKAEIRQALDTLMDAVIPFTTEDEQP